LRLDIRNTHDDAAVLYVIFEALRSQLFEILAAVGAVFRRR